MPNYEHRRPEMRNWPRFQSQHSAEQRQNAERKKKNVEVPEANHQFGEGPSVAGGCDPLQLDKRAPLVYSAREVFRLIGPPGSVHGSPDEAEVCEQRGVRDAHWPAYGYHGGVFGSARRE